MEVTWSSGGLAEVERVATATIRAPHVAALSLHPTGRCAVAPAATPQRNPFDDAAQQGTAERQCRERVGNELAGNVRHGRLRGGFRLRLSAECDVLMSVVGRRGAVCETPHRRKAAGGEAILSIASLPSRLRPLA